MEDQELHQTASAIAASAAGPASKGGTGRPGAEAIPGAVQTQSFLGVELIARQDVLVPRKETEILGTAVLAVLRSMAVQDPGGELRMIDMGCGAGNLACAVAVAMPQARVWASDISAACVDLTRENVERHSLGDRVQVTHGDLFAPLAGLGLEGSMDVVVMNPPYIPSRSLKTSHAWLLQNEPREAFDGGPYGISILGRLLKDSPAFLRPGGKLLFEFGLGQERIVQSLVERGNLFPSLRFVPDDQGNPRAAVLEK